ncbi:hypothetical protein IE81DRAFT_98207 [Ceraceosorus guamensis]|uniref:Uncharacterized protein n=1 Tax=Ceraceosorus guamensis TaxID=1522189 RepID=A0A316VZY7_9BASI|nr:hypothetical protein IE81DRAFT_98207 [Ceraceosorus guamensis]PWN43156.1 hypothetical protein IE81DRAFT_98207 [Ceraceosorus guamensis]
MRALGAACLLAGLSARRSSSTARRRKQARCCCMLLRARSFGNWHEHRRGGGKAASSHGGVVILPWTKTASTAADLDHQQHQTCFPTFTSRIHQLSHSVVASHPIFEPILKSLATPH